MQYILQGCALLVFLTFSGDRESSKETSTPCHSPSTPTPSSDLTPSPLCPIHGRGCNTENRSTPSIFLLLSKPGHGLCFLSAGAFFVRSHPFPSRGGTEGEV